jgi:FkbM family methyltransferase
MPGKSPRRAIIEIVQRSLRQFGLALVRDPIPGSLPFELGRILRTLEINCVLDVGANVGQYVSLLRERALYRGYVVSFEPASDTFKSLTEACRNDPMWSGHRCGLGRQQASLSLNRFSGSDFNSVLSPSEFALSRFPRALQPEGTEVVDVRRLDDVFDSVIRHVVEPRVFMKVDTQGLDLDVLAGAGARTTGILGLQMEASFHAVYEGVPSVIDMLNDVNAAGYDLAGVFPVTKHTDRMRIIEADCLFVARPGAMSQREV